MDEYECENLVADLWAQRGWQTQVTTESRDSGIDIIARRSSPISQKHLIQVKRYGPSNKIGRADIQQYGGLYRQESNVDSVIVVTTSSFTEPARATAQKLNVKLIDGAELTEQILDAWGEWATEYIQDLAGSEEEAGSETNKDTSPPLSDGTNIEDYSVSEYSEAQSSNSNSASAWQQRQEPTSTLSVPQNYLQKWRKQRQLLSVLVFATSLFGGLWLFGTILNFGTILSVLLSLGVGILGFGLFVYTSYKLLKLVYFIRHED
jgi:hypothetical protein